MWVAEAAAAWQGRVLVGQKLRCRAGKADGSDETSHDLIADPGFGIALLYVEAESE